MKYTVTGITIVALFLFWQPDVRSQPFSPTGQPSSYDIRFEPPEITGYRGVRLGESMEEVKRTLTHSFPSTNIEENLDPVQRTTVLTLVVPELQVVDGIESPGIATLNYVFGYKSQQLIALHLDWHVQGNADEEQRRALMAAGTAYAAELMGYSWEPGQTIRGQVIGHNAVVLFAGRDSNGAGVEVRLEGVSLDVMLPDGTDEHRAARSGPAHLYIGLAVNPDEPDIYRLPEGSF